MGASIPRAAELPRYRVAAGGNVMTVVGKIFVIVNLLLSLLTGALIMMVFVNRTNWAAAHEDLKGKYDKSIANANTLVEEVRKERQEKQAAEQLAANAANIQKQEAAAHQQALTDRDNQITGLQAQLGATRANLDAATVDLKRREQEVANLKTAAGDQNTKINTLETDIKGFRDRAVAAELNFNSEHERNTLLLAQLEKVTQDFERAQAGATGRPAPAGAAAQRTPSIDMKGSVLESDPNSGLVTISIGSDSGVEMNHVLNVYRLEPDARYVGKIRIVDAQHKQAVGRAVKPLTGGPIRVGDTVSNKIQ
jgi:hypothetical protein